MVTCIRRAMAASCWWPVAVAVRVGRHDPRLHSAAETPRKITLPYVLERLQNLGKLGKNPLHQRPVGALAAMAATGRNFSIIHEKIMPCRLVCMCPTMDLVASLHADGQLSVHRYKNRNTRCYIILLCACIENLVRLTVSLHIMHNVAGAGVPWRVTSGS